MQDDITDGVRWAVEQGVADKNRVCIYGASYGGYAVMMGLAKDPELYRCGVNVVGVTDIATMLSATWSDFANSDFLRYSARDMLGDPAEAERLAAVSPVKQAAKIRAPVLMAYGRVDRRVPIVHGEMMRSALEDNGRKYEWMVFEGEGHGFRSPDNQAKFYGSVERFLKENLATGP
jgi:dipeptidyl aminopeptidase/acylaminoacyl peptidase